MQLYIYIYIYIYSWPELAVEPEGQLEPDQRQEAVQEEDEGPVPNR